MAFLEPTWLCTWVPLECHLFECASAANSVVHKAPCCVQRSFSSDIGPQKYDEAKHRNRELGKHLVKWADERNPVPASSRAKVGAILRFSKHELVFSFDHSLLQDAIEHKQAVFRLGLAAIYSKSWHAIAVVESATPLVNELSATSGNGGCHYLFG